MDRNTIWDPLRKKDVALTPEENVRQWFIRYLNTGMQVPLHLMMSESFLRLGDKQFRADIVIYDRQAHPLAIVECKRPDVTLDSDVIAQAVRYNMVLDVKYIIITNGKHTHICGKKPDGDGYMFLDHAPLYEEMLGLTKE
ncbi:MAG: type I restriction enzyme HsdR N-terminal domain-containing protein [Bacteroidetes bacterium]|uniref:Type I restriction enzyme HsdR N-terminal domain-containing protein n=1 Tax=Candidatus Cryptobacteroides intestinavium TaxID=2840766 RepID=A0A9D9HEL3_9BACT|nr:type I restriction enzyme HsdR N-terminal domain-containing protein [Candidatus Cryptobacteroides intestinavium]